MHVVVDESRKSWYYYTHEDIVFVRSIFTCLQLAKIIISAHSYNILPSLVQFMQQDGHIYLSMQAYT